MNKMAKALAIFGCAIAMICSLTSEAVAALPNVTIEQDVAYGPDPVQRLDITRPKNSTAPRVGIILIHGGGWISGDKNQWGNFGEILAAKGAVAVAINYRLADGSSAHRWPAQLVDAQLAVRWVRSHAAALGIDPSRLTAWGASAGSHLSIFLGELDQAEPGDYAKELPGVSSKVARVVDNFGPTDLTQYLRRPIMPRLFGSLSGAALTDAARAASPLFRVTATTAPTMIVQGSTDTTVPPEQSSTLYVALQKAGVQSWLVNFPAQHGFVGLPQSEVAHIHQLELEYLLDTPALQKGER